MERALQKNITTIYWMSFFQSGMIVTAVFVPLLQRHGLSMAQVLQTQALFALVIALLEVPSGYLADLWGRKNTIVLGQALCTVAFIRLLSADGFVDFLVYEALMGAGLSLCSGADLALLYDSQSALNESGGEHSAQPGRHIARLVAIEGYAGAAAAGIVDRHCPHRVRPGRALRLLAYPEILGAAGHSRGLVRLYLGRSLHGTGGRGSLCP